MERVSKYRVGDDWINCEMAYLKKRMKFDDSDAVLTTETSVPILFAMLEEIKERRENDTSGGVTMERVSDRVLEGIINDQGNIIAGSWNAIHYLLIELQARRKAEKDGAGATQEKAVLPIPCTKGVENLAVKDYFQKINEELDEPKEGVFWFRKERIAEEAADIITAITSMLEAMGIDEQARQAAQKLVNEHNRQRGRF